MNAEAVMAEDSAAGSCGGHWPGMRFQFGAQAGAPVRCLWHGITYPKVLKTALATSAVVGTILTSINQGNVLLDGRFPDELWWKIPLTYSVPYCVSTFSALRISRLRN